MADASVSDVGARATRFAQGTDLGWVASLLADRRHEILERWLDVTSSQAFHAGRRERAVADHLPRLFDSVVALLRTGAPSWANPSPPLDDPDVVEAASAHADARFRQGLGAADIVTEFRVLRQEIGRALRLHVTDDVPTVDVLGAQLVVNDALDAAASLALQALTRQVEEAREDFLATTLHDVRQPLSSIKGSIQLAGRALSHLELDRDRIVAVLTRADAETNRMIGLLETLMDVSRMALGRLEPSVAPVDLSGIVHTVVARADTPGRLRVEMADGLDAMGVWDGAMLERVVTNLVSNGLKYSPPDSPVTISLRHELGTVHLTVRDEGIGLAAEELPHLFRRYGRAMGAVTAGVEGLGLGLYLSRGIVESHGGRIWAESTGPGKGTTIHVALPRIADRAMGRATSGSDD